MWSAQNQQKIIQNFKKEKDIYKFLELISLIHEEVAENLKQKKLLNLKDDLDFIEDLMKIVKPKKSIEEKIIKEKLTFDENIFYTLEGLFLGLKEYLNNKPKEGIIEITTEKDVKNLLEESYRTLWKVKKEEDLEPCKQNFSKAACLILCGVPVNEHLPSQIPYKNDNRVMLWAESIMQTIEHSKDYPITLPSDFQSTIDAIWKNLKKYEIDKDLIASPNVKENYKKINILVKNFIKEFLKNKIEIEKALSVLRPMYIEYIDNLSSPKIKEKTAIATARGFFGESKVLQCDMQNIDSDVLNPKIEEYNKKYSKKADFIEGDYVTVWKVALEKKKLLKKQRIVVLVDSKTGDVVGSYA